MAILPGWPRRSPGRICRAPVTGRTNGSIWSGFSIAMAAAGLSPRSRSACFPTTALTCFSSSGLSAGCTPAFDHKRGGGMHSRQDQTHAVANRDVNPSDQLVATYPDLACLLRNEAVSAAFAGYEEKALHWKRFYTFYGRLSLVAVMLAMVSFDYQITLKHIYGGPHFLAGIAAAFAATGLVSQALLGLTHAKDRWLAARFGAERLRSFKFQLFMVLEEVSDAESLAVRVKQRTSEGLAALEQELMGGRSAILEFSPFDVLSPPRHKTAHHSKKLSDEAASAYDILRFTVETQHFEERFRAHDAGTRFPSLLAELSFMAGAMLASVGILTALLPSEWHLAHILTAPTVME